MKTLRYVTMALALTLMAGSGAVHGQGLLKKLGKAAENAAERALTRQTEKRVEGTIDKTVEGALDGKGAALQKAGSVQQVSGNTQQVSGDTQQVSGNTQQTYVGDSNAAPGALGPQRTVVSGGHGGAGAPLL